MKNVDNSKSKLDLKGCSLSDSHVRIYYIMLTLNVQDSFTETDFSLAYDIARFIRKNTHNPEVRCKK